MAFIAANFLPALHALRAPLAIAGLLLIALLGGLNFLTSKVQESQRDEALEETRQLLIAEVRGINDRFQRFEEAFRFMTSAINLRELLQADSTSPDGSFATTQVRRFLFLNRPLVSELRVVQTGGSGRTAFIDEDNYLRFSEMESRESWTVVSERQSVKEIQIEPDGTGSTIRVIAVLNIDAALMKTIRGFAVAHPSIWVSLWDFSGTALTVRNGSRTISPPPEFESNAATRILADARDKLDGSMMHDATADDSISMFVSSYAPLEFGRWRALLIISKDESARLQPFYRSLSVVILAALITIFLLILIFFLFTRQILSVQAKIESARVSLENTNLELHDAIASARGSEQRAQASNQAKSAFLAMISHEIRTPLNGILGFGSLMLHDKTLSAENRTYLHTIQSSGETLLALINDLLDFSKIESGRLELENTATDLRSVVEFVINILRPQTLEKGLVISLEIDDEIPPEILIDAARVRQILMNLVGNALKFTPSGKIDVRVALNQSLGDDTIDISVSDTGIGISPEVRERLFKPFTQGDASTTRKYGGTGLGLAISKRLATLMDGDLRVESHPKNGSTFTLLIPFHPVNVTADKGETNPPSGQRASGNIADADTQSDSKLNVLIAEDNEVNQRLLFLMLKRHGITADRVSDGNEAVAAARSKQYDLILMDFQMPNLDGISATRKIRAFDNQGDVKPWIVAITANAMEDDRKLAFEAGMNDYLTKPVRADRLQKIISKCRAHLSA